MLFQRKIFTYAEKERGDESSSFQPPAPGGGVKLDAAGGAGCPAVVLVRCPGGSGTEDEMLWARLGFSHHHRIAWRRWT